MLNLNSRISALQKRRANGEKGFTLIELLVVMIIIGILAAIAIPIYLNQQKSARDSATTSDVKNLATNVQSLLVPEPDATVFKLNPAGAANRDATTVRLTVGPDTNYVDVAKTKGTVLTMSNSTVGGTFTIEGYNPNGKAYVPGVPAEGENPAVAATPLKYDSAAGGLKQ